MTAEKDLLKISLLGRAMRPIPLLAIVSCGISVPPAPEFDEKECSSIGLMNSRVGIIDAKKQDAILAKPYIRCVGLACFRFRRCQTFLF
jgi:hypothetical protein